MNLFEKFDDLITPSVATQLAARVNDTSGNTEKALRGVYYTLIAGLLRKCNSSMGTSMLHSQIQKGGEAGAMMFQLDKVVNSPELFAEKIQRGTKLLSQVFPGYKSPLINMIGTYAEVSKHPTSQYAHFGTALLVDILDDRIRTDKLTPEGLANYLREHHVELITKSPEGLLDTMIPALGLQEMRTIKYTQNAKKGGSAAPLTENELSATVEPEHNFDDLHTPRKPWWPYALGALVAIGLGIGGWWYYTKVLPNQQAEPVAETQPVETVVVDSLTVQPDSVAAAVDTTINEQSGNFSGMGKEIVTYLMDTTKVAGQVFELEKLGFVAGTTNLDPQSSATLVDELVELMKNYPRMQVRIQGYDMDGNKGVALRRALALKRELLNKGVDNNRIDAAGFTELGKSKVSVKVISK